MMKYVLILLCLMIGIANAAPLPSLSHRKLVPIVTNTKMTPLLSRIQASRLTDEQITFFYKRDHSFVMQINHEDKIFGRWHIAPDGKFCRYFDVVRKTVLCDYWYDTGAEYLVISTKGDELHSVIPKSAVIPLVTTH